MGSAVICNTVPGFLHPGLHLDFPSGSPPFTWSSTSATSSLPISFFLDYNIIINYSTTCISHHSSHHNLTAASPLAHSRGCVVTGPSHYVGVSALSAASATLARSVCVCGARERGNQVNEGSAVGQPFIS